MKKVKYLLYRILGLKTYLLLISNVYINYIKLGLGKKKFQEIHYLEKIIKPGFYCIDIGANVGYFSFFMSKYCGNGGKVIAVEPVKVFSEIWEKNVRKTKKNNAVLCQYALGEENKEVKMGMPVVDGGIHHGMTKIISQGDNSYEKLFDVNMRIPDELFKDIEKIDFVKIDVEGYENIVFNNMRETLSKYKPLIQSELGGEYNREESIRILSELSYEPYILQNDSLIKISSGEIKNYNRDFYFKVDPSK